MKVNKYLEKLQSEIPKKKNSRRKGNNFENKICKILNERFKTEEFSRTPGSGAYATSHKLPSHLVIYGDIITPQAFKYFFECKKGYNNFGIHDLLNSKSLFNQMLEECETIKAKNKKDFIFILCQDRRPPIAFMDSRLLGSPRTHYNSIKVGSYTGMDIKDLLAFENDFFFESGTIFSS